jgi:hypothetical protein
MPARLDLQGMLGLDLLVPISGIAMASNNNAFAKFRIVVHNTKHSMIHTARPGIAVPEQQAPVAQEPAKAETIKIYERTFQRVCAPTQLSPPCVNNTTR